MKLSSFQIINCFGFRDSGEINLLSNKNLIYVLGRNSSGKSTLLNAIKHFELYKLPSEHTNFTNFNPSDETPRLISKFIIIKHQLSVDNLTDNILNTLKITGINESIVESSTEIKNYLQLIIDHYSPLISLINSRKEVVVEKLGNGNYKFLLEKSIYNDFDEREKAISNAKLKLIDNKGFFRYNNRNYQFKIDFQDIENSLFNQFPKIYLFNEEYALLDNLPERITIQNIGDQKNNLLNAFIDYLGRDSLNKYLVSNDPDDRLNFLEDFKKNTDSLCDEINTSLKKERNEKLIEIIVHEHNGLQVTVKTDGKKSFYSHLSDNTKFLFAYFLYKNVQKIKNDILLFDEPNNGFHPSAQTFLLHFLKSLAKDGNLIILSTHSEYLVDIDYLPDIRIMVSDENNFLLVKNNFYSTKQEKGEYLALQPLYDAIGLKYGSLMNIRQNVILTEGITDLLYIRSFFQIFRDDSELNIAPSRGDSNILTLIPFFLSQGISLKIILDSGSHIKSELKKSYYLNDKNIWEVPIPPKFNTTTKKSGIEDLFSKDDFKEIIEEFDNEFNKMEFEKTTNSSYIRKRNFKRIAAHEFFKKSIELQAKDFNKQTLHNFKELMKFCKNENWFNFNI